jgi:hypothetical protein
MNGDEMGTKRNMWPSYITGWSHNSEGATPLGKPQADGSTKSYYVYHVFKGTRWEGVCRVPDLSVKCTGY